MFLEMKMAYHLLQAKVYYELGDIKALDKHSELYTKYLNQLHPIK